MTGVNTQNTWKDDYINKTNLQNDKTMRKLY